MKVVNKKLTDHGRRKQRTANKEWADLFTTKKLDLEAIRHNLEQVRVVRRALVKKANRGTEPRGIEIGGLLDIEREAMEAVGVIGLAILLEWADDRQAMIEAEAGESI